MRKPTYEVDMSVKYSQKGVSAPPEAGTNAAVPAAGRISVVGAKTLSVYVEPGDTTTTGWTVYPAYFTSGDSALDPERPKIASEDKWEVVGLDSTGLDINEFRALNSDVKTFDVPPGAVEAGIWVSKTPDGPINYELGSQ